MNSLNGYQIQALTEAYKQRIEELKAENARLCAELLHTDALLKIERQRRREYDEAWKCLALYEVE